MSTRLNYMSLNWNKEVMLKCKENLENKKDINESDEFLIDFYEEYLDSEKVCGEIEILNEKEIIEILSELVLNYRILFSELSKRYAYNFYNLIDGLKTYCIENLKTPVKLIKDETSEEEMIALSHEVYNSISPDFNNCLSYIYDNGLVKITGEFDETGSLCYTDYFNKKGFIYFPVEEKKSNIASFNHELAHSIITYVNSDFFEENYDLSEFHSLFMETYTDRYMYDKTKNKMFLRSQINSLEFLKICIFNFSLISSLSHLKGKLTKQKIIDMIYISFGIDLTKDFVSYFNKILNEIDIFDNYNYLFSACCSFNLINNEDIEKIRKCFSSTCFDENLKRRDFFKTINFNMKNDNYFYDILDKQFKATDSWTRKK